MKKYILGIPLALAMSTTAMVAQAGDVKQFVDASVNKVGSVLGQAMGDDMPQWMKRFEFKLELNEDYEPTGSILTVQPIMQAEDKRHTLFTQMSYLNYEQFGDRKDTTNVGLGYRYVTEDHSALVGTNVFYDHEWNEGHDRVGYGIEAKMGAVDLTANYYDAVSGAKSVSATEDERALDGYDVELRSQIPYMPWARLGVGYYKWDGVDFDDVEGIRVALDMDVTPNLGVEVGFSDDDDDTQDTQFFANLVYSFGTDGKARALSDNTGTLFSHGIDSVAFVNRDMRDHTLNKVRRQNKIVTERDSIGISISRAN